MGLSKGMINMNIDQFLSQADPKSRYNPCHNADNLRLALPQQDCLANLDELWLVLELEQHEPSIFIP